MKPLMLSRKSLSLRIVGPMALLFLCFAVGLATGAEQEVRTRGASESARPSVMILLVDDWSYSDWCAMREDELPWNDLPVIDSLRVRGQTWSQFYTQPICNLTRQCLLFGNYAGRVAGPVCAEPLPSTPAAGTLSIASNLRGLGFRTASFGKWHVGPNPNAEEPWERVPAAYGFDQWRAFNASNLNRHCGSWSYTRWHRVDDGVGVESNEYHTSAVAEAAKRWWQTTEGSKFAYVCFQAPHPPFHMPKADQLPADYPLQKSDRGKYEAMLVALDSAIGNLLAVVDLDSTYVILMADNGSPPQAVRAEGQSKRRMKKSVYQDGIHVPFIISGPGVVPGEVQSLGHAVDLLATVNELVGGRPGQLGKLDSISLAPVIRGQVPSVRDGLVTEIVSTWRDRKTLVRTTTHALAVLQKHPGNGHLIKGIWTRLLSGESSGGLERTLYDLTLDPREEAPLGTEEASHASEVRILEAARAAYLERVGAPKPPSAARASAP